MWMERCGWDGCPPSARSAPRCVILHDSERAAHPLETSTRYIRQVARAVIRYDAVALFKVDVSYGAGVTHNFAGGSLVMPRLYAEAPSHAKCWRR
jgi:hypothetical protein